MKILFNAGTRLTDTVLSTGVLARLREEYPQAGFTVVCGAAAAPLFYGLPGLEGTIEIPEGGKGTAFRLRRTIRRQSPWDLIVDIAGDLPVRAAHKGRKRHDPDTHKVERAARIMNAMDAKNEGKAVPAPQLWISEKDWGPGSARVPKGPDELPVLALAPMTGEMAKIWPPGCYLDLIADVFRPKGVFAGWKIAVICAPGEEYGANQIYEMLPPERRIDLMNKGNIAQAAASIAQCGYFIGSESGLVHCASAVGTPCMALFGPGRPAQDRPWGACAAYVSTPETIEELTDYKDYDPEWAPCLMGTLNPIDVRQAIESHWRGLNIAA